MPQAGATAPAYAGIRLRTTNRRIGATILVSARAVMQGDARYLKAALGRPFKTGLLESSAANPTRLLT
jgi:hypothetical protein